MTKKYIMKHKFIKDLKDSMYIFPIIEYPNGITGGKFNSKLKVAYDINNKKLLRYPNEREYSNLDRYTLYLLEEIKEINITSTLGMKIKYDDLYIGANIKLIDNDLEYIFLGNIPLPKNNNIDDFELHTMVTIVKNKDSIKKEKTYEKYRIIYDNIGSGFITYLIPSTLIDENYKINKTIILKEKSIQDMIMLIEFLKSIGIKYNKTDEYKIEIIEKIDNSIDYILTINNSKKINITKDFLEYIVGPINLNYIF